MSPAEMFWRSRDQALKAAWSRRQVHRGKLAGAVTPPAGQRPPPVALPPGTADRVPAAARDALLATAGRLLHGEAEVLGVARTDLRMPDWFADPVTGRRSAADRYAFRINHRSEEQTGNIKQVWEVARLHHLTQLAAAWFLTHDEQYAQLAAAQLRSFWQENPFLSGVHWTSGIEIGVRLVSLAWIRRLLDDWPGAADLFERDDLAVQQIYWHQHYLATFRSRGSSANNHVIAEAAGQLVASCAFGWFPASRRWRRQSARLLERELITNTFPSGIGRELASDYQAFVAELGLLAAIEAGAAGYPLAPGLWPRLAAMTDSCAAIVDEQQRPPRQGDGDEGRALVVDAPERASWPALLALGEGLFGRLPWWPETTPDVRSTIAAALAGPVAGVAGRPAARPDHFPDAGMTLLRTAATVPGAGQRPGGTPLPEIWCRCDAGPHGFLSIAAHAHADALSVEVRYGGVDVLADPGTYCYHGEPAWRSYFRSTIAHNTVELGGRNQSQEGGPFLWVRHARTQLTEASLDGPVARWAGQHDGYTTPGPGGCHHRSVQLDRSARSLDISDEISAVQDLRLAFHLGPDIEAELDGSTAVLSWPAATAPGGARLELPGQLHWSLHRGETDPVLGWYSPAFGRKVPAFTLIGAGTAQPGTPLRTRLQFTDTSPAADRLRPQSALSWVLTDALAPGGPDE
jgi:hypothetical protein